MAFYVRDRTELSVTRLATKSRVIYNKSLDSIQSRILATSLRGWHADMAGKSTRGSPLRILISKSQHTPEDTPRLGLRSYLAETSTSQHVRHSAAKASKSAKSKGWVPPALVGLGAAKLHQHKIPACLLHPLAVWPACE